MKTLYSNGAIRTRTTIALAFVWTRETGSFMDFLFITWSRMMSSS